MNTTSSSDHLPKELAAQQGMVNIQIDGKWIQVPKGTRIIEACRQQEVDVPHYCYHPKLSSPGNCRMCLVQTGMPPRPALGDSPTYNESGYQDIQWSPHPTISCSNTVVENMGIRTQGNLVESCRKGVMELLLINHPLDCPICDQAGECHLQEFSVEYGNASSRFKEMKIKKPKNTLIGKRVRLDDERCILCSRCVRFMDEVADDPVLGFTDRGVHTTLSCHPDQSLDDNYSLNTVDICPVGALTSNDFRFQMRVWFLKQTPSIDVNCGTGTNITLWSRENQIYRITPRQNDEVNSCWMPDSHRLNFNYLNGDKRLIFPSIKPHKTPSTWREAIEKTAQSLAHLNGEKIAIIASGKNSNEELFLLKQLARHLKTPHLSIIEHKKENDGKLISADRNPNTTGAKLIWGEKDPSRAFKTIHTDVSIGKIKALLVFDENVISEKLFNENILRSLDFIAVADVLANPTATFANVVFPNAAFAEKSATMINVTGRIQRLNQAILAPGEAQPLSKTLVSLLEVLGVNVTNLANPADLFVQMSQSVDALNDLSFESIGDQGTVVLDTGISIPLIEKEKQRIAQGIING